MALTCANTHFSSLDVADFSWSRLNFLRTFCGLTASVGAPAPWPLTPPTDVLPVADVITGSTGEWERKDPVDVAHDPLTKLRALSVIHSSRSSSCCSDLWDTPVAHSAGEGAGRGDPVNDETPTAEKAVRGFVASVREVSDRPLLPTSGH